MITNAWTLGVDLGGTQLRMAAVTPAGALATPVFAAPTGKDFLPEQLFEKLRFLHQQVRAVTEDHAIAALGMGITGLVGPTSISQADFLPHLNGVDLIALIRDALGYPASIENDARCFVLAETKFGAAREAKHVVGLTLGTGIGGGVIVDGKLVRGATANAGEVWGIPLRGKWLEYFVSTEGLVRGYQEAGGKDSPVNAEKIAVLARQGSTAAQLAYAAYAEDLWNLCETIRALLDPEVLVIGGSIAQARDVFGEEFTARLAGRGRAIRWAELGTAAGVIGAACLPRDLG